MEQFEALWRGGPRFLQTEDCFKLSTDSVLLADFANSARARNCLDLGSGAGVLSVLLAFLNPKLEICGIELQESFAELSKKNLAENGMDKRSKIICGDLREHSRLLPVGTFDLVVANPPYFKQMAGASPNLDFRAAAREEKFCTLSDLCAAAKWALRWGGDFALVHKPERLSEVFVALSLAGLEPKRLRLVQSRSFSPPSLVLIEARRGGAQGLKILPPLILNNDNGTNSAEMQRIYHIGEGETNL
ncbi:MAG: methyltransferase [Oscillospiraceae bacterium]